MLALCLMLSMTCDVQNYAGITGGSLLEVVGSHNVTGYSKAQQCSR